MCEIAPLLFPLKVTVLCRKCITFLMLVGVVFIWSKVFLLYELGFSIVRPFDFWIKSGGAVNFHLRNVPWRRAECFSHLNAPQLLSTGQCVWLIAEYCWYEEWKAGWIMGQTVQCLPNMEVCSPGYGEVLLVVAAFWIAVVCCPFLQYLK